MPTTAEYLNDLVNQKNALVDNLNTKGIDADRSETLNTLVPKVLEIQGGDTDIAYEEGVEAGKKEAYDYIWDAFQNNGNRKEYEFLFYYAGHYSKSGMDFYNFKPKYTLNVSDGRSMFETAILSLDLTTYLADDNNGLKIDFSNVNNANNMFAFSLIKRVPPIRVVSGNTSSMFNQSDIEIIDGLEIAPTTATTKVSNPFGSSGATKLKKLTWNGTISFNGIDLSKSPNLTKTSIESTINALSDDISGLTITLSLVAVQKAFETTVEANDGNTSEEWLSLTATKPNWTITLA